MKRLSTIFLIMMLALMMASPLMAEELAKGQVDGSSTITAPGFYWDHCRTTYRPIGATYTMCYLDTNNAWIWTYDDMSENILIACAESNHWCGITVNAVSGSSFTWTDLRIYKY